MVVAQVPRYETYLVDLVWVLTVNFDVALAGRSAHVIGGPNFVLSGHAARSAVDGQAVEAVGVLVGLDPRVLRDLIASLEPGDLWRRRAVDLALQDDLLALVRLLVSEPDQNREWDIRFKCTTNIFVRLFIMTYSIKTVLFHCFTRNMQ